MKIICDTNVWYEIEKEDVFIVENKKLIGTWVNFVELFNTPNLITGLSLVQKAIKALHYSHFELIKDNPLDFIIKSHYKDYENADNSFNHILDVFEKIMSIDTKAKVDNLNYEELKGEIETRKEKFYNLSNTVNEIMKEVRGNIKKNSNKKEHRKIDTVPLIKKILINFITVYTKGEIIIDAKFDWSPFDLLIFIMGSYFKEIELSPNMKFKENDWYDLFILAYVSPSDKFWTFEKHKWSKIIRDNDVYSKYLYNN